MPLHVPMCVCLSHAVQECASPSAHCLHLHQDWHLWQKQATGRIRRSCQASRKYDWRPLPRYDPSYNNYHLTYIIQTAYLYDQKSLVDQLEVTTDLGGTLNYNHTHWVYNRLVSYNYSCCYRSVHGLPSWAKWLWGGWVAMVWVSAYSRNRSQDSASFVAVTVDT